MKANGDKSVIRIIIVIGYILAVLTAWGLDGFNIKDLPVYLFGIAAFISFAGTLVGLFSFFIKDRSRKCDCRTTGTLTNIIKGDRACPENYYEFSYEANGEWTVSAVSDEYTEGISADTPVGTRCCVWYSRKDPGTFIASTDNNLSHNLTAYRDTLKISLVFLLISTGCLVLYLCCFY